MKNNFRSMIPCFAAILLSAGIFTGCNNQLSSDGLKNQILERCTPLAEDWFDANMRDAGNPSVELYYISRGEVCSDVVTGAYSKNDRTYCYYLNVDAGEFCSEEYYDVLYEYLKSELAECLGTGFSDLAFPLEEAVIHGEAVSDQVFGIKQEAPRTYAYSGSCYRSYEMFSMDELPDTAHETLSAACFEITAITDDIGKTLRDPRSLEFLKEHENWALILKDTWDTVLDHRINYEDGQYRVIEAFYDDRGLLQFKTYFLED